MWGTAGRLPYSTLQMQEGLWGRHGANIHDTLRLALLPWLSPQQLWCLLNLIEILRKEQDGSKALRCMTGQGRGCPRWRELQKESARVARGGHASWRRHYHTVTMNLREAECLRWMPGSHLLLGIYCSTVLPSCIGYYRKLWGQLKEARLSPLQADKFF